MNGQHISRVNTKIFTEKYFFFSARDVSILLQYGTSNNIEVDEFNDCIQRLFYVRNTSKWKKLQTNSISLNFIN
jgi:hypothetical protein